MNSINDRLVKILLNSPVPLSARDVRARYKQRHRKDCAHTGAALACMAASCRPRVWRLPDGCYTAKDPDAVAQQAAALLESCLKNLSTEGEYVPAV